MTLFYYFLSKNNVRNKNTEFQLQNEALDFPCDQENLCLYSWTTPNMITLLAGLLVKSEGMADSVVYHSVKAKVSREHGLNRTMANLSTLGKHVYFEKSPGNKDCVGLQNVL